MNIVKLRNKLHDVKNLLRTHWDGQNSLDTAIHKSSECKIVKQKVEKLRL